MFAVTPAVASAWESRWLLSQQRPRQGDRLHEVGTVLELWLKASPGGAAENGRRMMFLLDALLRASLKGGLGNAGPRNFATVFGKEHSALERIVLEASAVCADLHSHLPNARSLE